MENLFKKAIIFTDVHFGLKSNSHIHNQDCADYIDWIIDTAKTEGCETALFLGDWHHYRSTLNISTLNYSLDALEKLSKAFDNTYFIPGNHDLYYRDKRDVQGAEWARNIDGITIVNDFQEIGNCSFVPWLTGDEHKKLKKIKAKYMFGHFELPHFYMNALVKMPDNGEFSADSLRGVEQVYSGHFHKRQENHNVTYIGNAFPHNFSDAWDNERGCCILEWDKPHYFLDWEDAPKYRTFSLSKLIEDPDKYLAPKTYARVDLDIDISYEEATFIKETFAEQYKLRDITIIPNKQTGQNEAAMEGEINFESIDTIINSQLSQIESDVYSNNLLMEIYRNL